MKLTKGNFIILANKRTASTFLQFALNSHPNIVCYDEMWMYSGRAKKRSNIPLFKTYKSNKPKITKLDYLQYLFNMDKNSPVGFRLMYNQEKKYKLLDVIKAKKIKVIHLYRDSHAKRVFSKWTAGEDDPNPRRIEVNKLYNEALASEGRFKLYKKALGKYRNVIQIEMKELFGEVEEVEKEEISKKGAFNFMSNKKTFLKEDTNKKICKFLNVPVIPMWSNVAQKNKKSMKEYVLNYKELLKHFEINGKGDWLK